MTEIAYAWRVLRRAPGPTGLSVVTIGIGIAVNKSKKLRFANFGSMISLCCDSHRPSDN